MRNRNTLVLIVGLIAECLALRTSAGHSDLWNHVGAASNLVLKIASDTNCYTPRDPLILHVSLKNMGTTTVITTISDPLKSLHFELIDDTGELVPPTRWTRLAQKKAEEGRVSTGGGELAPGETEEFAIRLNAAFDLSKPCVYTLQVWGNLFTDAEAHPHFTTNRLCSNVISFEMDIGWEQIARSARADFRGKVPQPPYLLRRRDEDNRYR